MGLPSSARRRHSGIVGLEIYPLGATPATPPRHHPHHSPHYSPHYSELAAMAARIGHGAAEVDLHFLTFLQF